MPKRAPRKRQRPAKRLGQRRRATPAQPRKVRRRMATRSAAKPAKRAGSGRRSAPKARPKAAPSPQPPPVLRPAAPVAGKQRVVVFGAGGTLGSRIAAEASARGHAVTPVQRSPGFAKLAGKAAGMRRADATDAAAVGEVAKGHDAVVSAVAPPMDRPEQLVRVARAMVAGCRAAGVHRLIVVNGAGSLLVPAPDPQRREDHRQLMDSPGFPKDWRPVAQAHRDALQFLKDAGAGLQWTAISPPASIAPGVRTGRYQIGTDRLLRGRDGQSRISAEDYAVAVVDELEKGRFKGKRMTVAWP